MRERVKAQRVEAARLAAEPARAVMSETWTMAGATAGESTTAEMATPS